MLVKAGMQLAPRRRQLGFGGKRMWSALPYRTSSRPAIGAGHPRDRPTAARPPTIRVRRTPWVDSTVPYRGFRPRPRLVVPRQGLRRIRRIDALVRPFSFPTSAPWAISVPMGADSFPELDALLESYAAHIEARRCGRVAADFGDVTAEYHTLRTTCGILDPRLRDLVRVTGDDRSAFLQGMLSNDVVGCGPGFGVDAAILTVQARVVTDLRVYVHEGEIWLDIPAQRRALGQATLEKYIVADDVELVALDCRPLALVEGPQSPHLVQRVSGVDVASWMPRQHAASEIAGHGVWILSVTHSGERGFLIVGPTAAAATVWRLAVAAGAQPVGWDALEIARVEAGLPMMDADMDESYLAPEVGLAHAVSTKKGCYIGQEVVERVSARGNVQRKLIGVRLDGVATIEPGSELRHEGHAVGSVTSSAFSPALGCTIALAYGRRSIWEPGTRVQVSSASTNESAEVVPLPFLPQPGAAGFVSVRAPR